MKPNQSPFCDSSSLPLQHYEARLGRILNSLANEIYLLRVDNLSFLEVNESAHKNLGYSVKELKRLTLPDLIPGFTKQRFDTLIQPLLSGEKEYIHFETQQKRKDKSIYPADVRFQLYWEPEGPLIVAIVLDVSEHRHTQKALRESEERFDLAMRGANDGLWDWELGSNKVYFSPRWKSMLGYAEHELANHFDSWAKNVHPDDIENALQAIDNYANGQADEYSAEFRMRHKNGTYVDVLSRGLGVRDDTDRLIRIVGTHVDITERKRTETLLRESENKFRTIFDSSDDAIMLLKNGTFFDCNKATLKIFSCKSREEFITKKPSDLSPPKQPDGRNSLYLAEQRISEALRKGSNFFEWLHLRVNGEEFPAEVLLTTMRLDGEIVIEASVRDITERKKSEQILQQGYLELTNTNRELKETQAKLLQSEKMASIGQLAAGVAHEINNPVGYVSSNITSLQGYISELYQLLSAYEDCEHLLSDNGVKTALLELKQKIDIEFLRQDIDDLIGESLEGVTRVKQIAQDLKDFSHIDEAELQFADIHKGIDSTLNIVSNELKYKADIIKDYGNIPEVECMPSQLNQVFLNLLINASHAIENKGEIHIRTGIKSNEWVWIEIEDNGKGIAQDTIPRIFEPFFTTKEVGKGTGLGLSLAYGIIKKHNGKIDVNSELSKGTCFRIWLPQTKDDAD